MKCWGVCGIKSRKCSIFRQFRAGKLQTCWLSEVNISITRSAVWGEGEGLLLVAHVKTWEDNERLGQQLTGIILKEGTKWPSRITRQDLIYFSKSNISWQKQFDFLNSIWTFTSKCCCWNGHIIIYLQSEP